MDHNAGQGNVWQNLTPNATARQPRWTSHPFLVEETAAAWLTMATAVQSMPARTSTGVHGDRDRMRNGVCAVDIDELKTRRRSTWHPSRTHEFQSQTCRAVGPVRRADFGLVRGVLFFPPPKSNNYGTLISLVVALPQEKRATD